MLHVIVCVFVVTKMADVVNNILKTTGVTFQSENLPSCVLSSWESQR